MSTINTEQLSASHQCYLRDLTERFAMYFRAIILIALFGLGISQGLQCYQCVDGTPDGCDTPALVSCERKNANFQVRNLNFLFNIRKKIEPEEEYQCFSYESEIGEIF